MRKKKGRERWSRKEEGEKDEQGHSQAWVC